MPGLEGADAGNGVALMLSQPFLRPAFTLAFVGISTLAPFSRISGAKAASMMLHLCRTTRSGET